MIIYKLQMHVQLVFCQEEHSKGVVRLGDFERAIPVGTYLFVTCNSRNLGIQSTVLVDGAVPRILREHFEALCIVEILITCDDPVLAHVLEYRFGIFALEAAGAHFLEAAEGAINKEKVYILWIIARQMSGHRATE